MEKKKPLLRRIMEKVTPKKPKIGILPSGRPALPAEEQERLNGLLISAARSGNGSEIERLIRAGADVAAKDEDGLTALHWAAFSGHTKICAMLIDEYARLGGDVKEFIAMKGGDSLTPVQEAAENEHSETQFFLLQKYAEAGGDAKDL